MKLLVSPQLYSRVKVTEFMETGGTTKQAILKQFTDFYLSSGDFNGMPGITLGLPRLHGLVAFKPQHLLSV
jgi:hypothetical protein